MVMMTILEAIVYELDREFMVRYRKAIDTTKDPADRMRIDIIFSDKVGELRQAGLITKTSQEIRAKASEIVAQEPVEKWYGCATKYASQHAIYWVHL